MDGFDDLYDDSVVPEDSGISDGAAGDMEDTAVDDVDTPDIEDVIRDVLNDYFAPDEAVQEDDSETGSDAFTDPEAYDQGDGETYPETVDYSGMLSEISSAVNRHADQVSGFLSDVTLSGNSVMVSLDGDSAALISETIAGQERILEGMGYMNGLVLMVLFVLIFDILHRFAKRIVKNLTRGDDNKNAADS